MSQFKDGLLELNEYELHDLILSMRPAHEEESIGSIKIVPKDEAYFDADRKLKWEQKVNNLLIALRALDSEFHDDAEYTC